MDKNLELSVKLANFLIKARQDEEAADERMYARNRQLLEAARRLDEEFYSKAQ